MNISRLKPIESRNSGTVHLYDTQDWHEWDDAAPTAICDVMLSSWDVDPDGLLDCDDCISYVEVVAEWRSDIEWVYRQAERPLPDITRKTHPDLEEWEEAGGAS